MAEAKYPSEGPAGDLSELRRKLGECARLRGKLEAELVHRREEERLILDAVPAMIWFKDTENRVLRANRAAAASLGLAPAEVEGRSTFELYPEEAAGYHADDREVVATGRPKLGIVEPLQTASGERRWVQTDKIPYRDRCGRVVGVLVFAVDITERRWAELVLESQNRILRLAGEGVPVGVSLADLVRAVQDQMPGAYGAVLLLDAGGERGRVAAAPDVPPELCQALEELEMDPPGGACTASGGQPVAVDLSAVPPRDGGEAERGDLCTLWWQRILAADGRTLGAFALFVRQARRPAEFEQRLLASAARLAATAIESTQAREQLLYSALHDPLTGLPNRTLLLDRLEVAMKRSRRRDGVSFAVLFIDLDRFKVVNDSLGHMLGDELLKAIAERLKRRLRPGDTVARLGGDEFALLLEDLGAAEEASGIAGRIQEDLAEPFEIDGQEVFSSASIGIALGSSDYRRPEEMLRDADTAMYRAKAEGRSRHTVFQPAMHQRAVTQLRLESALRRALDRGELRLHYQPIAELSGGRIVGLEALLRWEHPELGLIGPDAFLGAAEEAGVLPHFEAWVLREACTQASAWLPLAPPGSGPPAPAAGIYVNLQSLQHSRDLAVRVAEALAATGLPPECLHCELTERALMQDVPAAVEILGDLRTLGVGVCVDDFGTGYSSLSYLLRFPVTALKIDRSFVGSLREGGHAALVESINSLAHTLDLAVIAEGVETADQLAILRRLGCEYAQGFLFSPALDPASAGELLSREPGWIARHFAEEPEPGDLSFLARRLPDLG